jgi:hypothetical protein
MTRRSRESERVRRFIATPSRSPELAAARVVRTVLAKKVSHGARGDLFVHEPKSEEGPILDREEHDRG